MIKVRSAWPKGPIYWRDVRASFASVPCTWNLGEVRKAISARGGEWIVGGPAIQLMPETFRDMPNVKTPPSYPGVLQRVNPYATRTTRGCPNKCSFCAIGQGKVEVGDFMEMGDWPDLPILCDNNLLAASERHIEKVCHRLRWWGWADFNQGLDCRLVTEEIAHEINSIGTPIVRIALDDWGSASVWAHAVHLFRAAGIAKRRLNSYVMIGHGADPLRDIERIKFAKDSLGPARATAMWFHELDATEANIVTDKQAALGWTDRLRIDVMRWSYGRGPRPK